MDRARALRLRPRSGAAALAAAYVALRLAPHGLRLLRTGRQLLLAADDASAVGARAAAEARAYVLAGPGSPAAPPRALRRVLRALAAPEALRILRHLAAAAASGAVQAAGAPGPGADGDAAERALRALASPAGERVVRTLVATAVREAIATGSDLARAEARRAGAKPGPPLVEKLIEAGLSDRGRRLILDAVAVVARVAVPIVLTAPPAPAPPASTATSTRAHRLSIPTSGVSSPRRGQSPSPAPASPHRGDALERLAARAFRDRGLVRDVVRVAAAEAVRAYLTTQARLRFGTGTASVTSSVGPSPAPSPARSLVATGVTAAAPGRAARERARHMRSDRVAPAAEEAPSALWRAIVGGIRADAHAAILRLAANRSSPGWILF